MANQIFSTVLNGVKTLVTAISASSGVGDAGKILALDSTGRIDSTMMPVGIGADTKSLVASEALSAGNLVNIWDDAGVAKARKADSTAAGKEAVGFVLAGVALGASATVYFDGTISGLTGLTIGSRQYLANTAGATAATAPSATGNVVQYVGRAVSATEITFEPDDAIVIA